MANLFWISAAQLVKDLGDGPHSASSLLARYGWTFSRADASTCAQYIDKDGISRVAQANFLRVQYEDLDGDLKRETPGILLEGSRANGWTKSQKLDDGVWTKDAASISANAGISMDGTQTGDKVVEDGTNALHGFERATPTLTDNTLTNISCFAMFFGSRLWFRFRTTDKAGVLRSTFFNIGAGTIGTTDAGHSNVKIEGPFGFLGAQGYRCSLSFNSASGGTAPLVQVFMATADNSGAYAGDGTSGIVFSDLQIEVDQPFRSSVITTDAATVTRAADSLTMTVPFGPADLTVLQRVVRPVHADASGDIGMEPATFRMGTPFPHVRGNFQQTVRQVRAYIGTNITDRQQVTTYPAGTSINVCSQFRNLSTGGITKLDTGSGFTSDSPTATGFAAYGSSTLEIGMNSTAQSLYGVLLDLKGRAGLQTLAAMQTEPAFAPRNPFELTDFSLPGPLISKAQSGRVNLRSTQQIGRSWTEHYLLKISDPTHREFLARMNNYWRNGTIFAKGHVDYATPKGVGGGVPLVKGASQTGSTLIVDGCPANTSGWLLAGDIFRVQGLPQAFMCAADVNTEGDGRALIPLVIPIFTGGSPSDNASLTITGVMLDVVLLEPPNDLATSGNGSDWGELVLKFSEAL